MNQVPSIKKIKEALWILLGMYILGIFCLQGFNMIYPSIGQSINVSPTTASLITAIPGVVFGIACFVYGALGDFLSLRKLVWFGVITLVGGSILGFFFHENLLLIIIWRCVQTIGFQTAGSAFVVLTAKYLKGAEKVAYFGLFTAGFQVGSGIGVLGAGFLSGPYWPWLFLVPVLTLALVPFLAKTIPNQQVGKQKIDYIGFIIFGTAFLFLTIFFAQFAWYEIVISLVLFVTFAIYISRVKNPLLPIDFFKNKRWWFAITLILTNYFTQFVFTPLLNQLGQNVYHVSPQIIGWLLLPSFAVAAIGGVVSGRLVHAVGRAWAIVISGIIQFSGIAILAVFAPSSWIAMVVGTVVLYLGTGFIFSPIYDSVLGTLPDHQLGRGVGLNDLTMQSVGSIGVALFSGLITGTQINKGSIFSLDGFKSIISHLPRFEMLYSAQTSNLLFILGTVMLIPVIWVLLFKKIIYGPISYNEIPSNDSTTSHSSQGEDIEGPIPNDELEKEPIVFSQASQVGILRKSLSKMMIKIQKVQQTL